MSSTCCWSFKFLLLLFCLLLIYVYKFISLIHSKLISLEFNSNKNKISDSSFDCMLFKTLISFFHLPFFFFLLLPYFSFIHSITRSNVIISLTRCLPLTDLKYIQEKVEEMGFPASLKFN